MSVKRRLDEAVSSDVSAQSSAVDTQSTLSSDVPNSSTNEASVSSKKARAADHPFPSLPSDTRSTKMESEWRRKYCHFAEVRHSRVGGGFQVGLLPDVSGLDSGDELARFGGYEREVILEKDESGDPRGSYIGGDLVDPSQFERQREQNQRNERLLAEIEAEKDRARQEKFAQMEKEQSSMMDVDSDALIKDESAKVGSADLMMDDEESDMEDEDWNPGDEDEGAEKGAVWTLRDALMAEEGASDDDSDFEAVTPSEREKEISDSIRMAHSSSDSTGVTSMINDGITIPSSSDRIIDGVIARRVRVKTNNDSEDRTLRSVTEYLVKWRGQMTPEWMEESQLCEKPEYESMLDAFVDELEDDYFTYESIVHTADEFPTSDEVVSSAADAPPPPQPTPQDHSS